MCNFHYPAMFMMTSQILKSVDFTKTQVSQYLENETLFFLQIKNFINYIHIKGYFMAKNSFVAEVTFKECKCKQIRNFLFPDLFTFTKEIFNGKHYFLCSAACRNIQVLPYIPVCTSLV